MPLRYFFLCPPISELFLFSLFLHPFGNAVHLPFFVFLTALKMTVLWCLVHVSYNLYLSCYMLCEIWNLNRICISFQQRWSTTYYTTILYYTYAIIFRSILMPVHGSIWISLEPPQCLPHAFQITFKSDAKWRFCERFKSKYSLFHSSGKSCHSCGSQ